MISRLELATKSLTVVTALTAVVGFVLCSWYPSVGVPFDTLSPIHFASAGLWGMLVIGLWAMTALLFWEFRAREMVGPAAAHFALAVAFLFLASFVAWLLAGRSGAVGIWISAVVAFLIASQDGTGTKLNAGRDTSSTSVRLDVVDGGDVPDLAPIGQQLEQEKEFVDHLTVRLPMLAPVGLLVGLFLLGALRIAFPLAPRSLGGAKPALLAQHERSPQGTRCLGSPTWTRLLAKGPGPSTSNASCSRLYEVYRTDKRTYLALEQDDEPCPFEGNEDLENQFLNWASAGRAGWTDHNSLEYGSLGGKRMVRTLSAELKPREHEHSPSDDAQTRVDWVEHDRQLPTDVRFASTPFGTCPD